MATERKCARPQTARAQSSNHVSLDQFHLIHLISFTMFSWPRLVFSVNMYVHNSGLKAQIIHSFIHSFINSFIHSFILSFMHSFMHSLIHLFTQSLIPDSDGLEYGSYNNVNIAMLTVNFTSVCNSTHTSAML